MSLRIPLGVDQTTQVEFHEVERRLRRLEKASGISAGKSVIRVEGGSGGGTNLQPLIARIEALEAQVANLGEIGIEDIEDYGYVGPDAQKGLVPDPGIAEPPTGVAQHVLTEDNGWGYPLRGLVQVATPGNETIPTDQVNVLGSLSVTGDASVGNLQANETTTLGQVLLSDGSRTVPSLSFAADTNLGLFRFGDNNIAATFSGQFRFHDPNGNEAAALIAGGRFKVAANGSMEWGSSITDIDAASDLQITRASAGTALVSTSGTQVGLRVKSGSSQTANLQEWQNSSGTALAYVSPTGDVWGKGQGFATVAKTAGYTVAAGDHAVMVSAAGGNVTITLPAAASHTGRIIHIKKTDSSANYVRIDGNASELVEDAQTQDLLLQGENLMLQCDGTQWWVL